MKNLEKLFVFASILASMITTPAIASGSPLVDCVVYVGGGYSGDYFTIPTYGVRAQMYGGAMKTWPAYRHADQKTGSRCNFITRYSRSGATAAEAYDQLVQAVTERNALFPPPPATRYFYILDPTTAGEWLFNPAPTEEYDEEACKTGVLDWVATLVDIYDYALGSGFDVVVLDVPRWDSLDLSASGFGIPASKACYEYAVSEFLYQFREIPLLKVWGVPKNVDGEPEWIAFDGVHPPAKVQKRASRRIGNHLMGLLEE